MLSSVRSLQWTCLACVAAVLAACGGSSSDDGAAQADAGKSVSVASDGASAAWTECAREGGSCSFSGTRRVRYGLDGRYVYRSVTGPIDCSNEVFGDPYPGADKLCWVASASAPTADAKLPYGQDASDYVLSFSEEFEGTSLDTQRWNSAIWYEASNPTQNYAVTGGSLKIWPQRDASGKFFNRTIDTDGKYYQTHGYFEIEAKLPRGKGAWPAFWLLNHDQPDPHRPEIDILEAYPGGGVDSGWSDADLRPTAYAATVWPTGWANGPAGSHTVTGVGDLSAGFHKYAVKWEPGRQTYYFDGKEVYSVNVSMGERMYILLDLWFGSASGEPDGTTPTGPDNAFEIRYVRAWKFKS